MVRQDHTTYGQPRTKMRIRSPKYDFYFECILVFHCHEWKCKMTWLHDENHLHIWPRCSCSSWSDCWVNKSEGCRDAQWLRVIEALAEGSSKWMSYKGLCQTIGRGLYPWHWHYYSFILANFPECAPWIPRYPWKLCKLS